MTQKFINVYGCTDIDSYAVLGDTGTRLTVQKVERIFTPIRTDRGFCTNNDDQRKAPVRTAGRPFELMRRSDGTIGLWEDDAIFVWNASSFADGALPGLLDKNPNWRVRNGQVYVYAGFRKDGKPKRRWREFPRPTDKCEAFYDYNF